MPPTKYKELVKDYCRNTTLGGFRYIADDTKHWTERLIWIILVALSWYGCALLIIAAWEAFVLSPISFGVETTYTHWNTKMPAVAICETSNNEKLYNVSDTIWSPKHLIDLEDALKEIVYFRGISYSLLRVCHHNKNPDPQCPMSNYSYYAGLVRSACPQIIANCSYNNIHFECCEYFQPLDTDIGKCFIINSIQTLNPKPYSMVSNRTNKHGVLKFDVLISSTVFTLGEDEVPTITTLQSSSMKIKLGYYHQRQVSVRNIENDPLIIQTTTEQRACRFHYENQGGLYPMYSYSACTVLCRKRAQMELCKCNDHFMLNTTEQVYCNISGIACLHQHSSHLTTLKPKWATRPGMFCDCMPSCNETDITVIKDVFRPNPKSKKKKTNVEIVLAHLPTERFKRNVVRSRLDLVVSVGGTAGLFVGASLLSFVELIFYFTVRFIGNLWMERQQRKINALKNHTKLNFREQIILSNNTGQIPLIPLQYNCRLKNDMLIKETRVLAYD